jgi:NhaP-type Na+/H+ or K+/H+ antiporter
VVAGIADFIIVMIGSCIVGLLVPGLTTLMLKHADLRKHPVLEISAYVLMSYVPYLLAEVRSMSADHMCACEGNRECAPVRS